MVTNADAVLSAARDQGMLTALAPGAIWAQMSTIGVAEFDRVAALAGAERPDVMLLDTPVSGSKDPAERGQLTIFASGPDEARAGRSAVRRAPPAHHLGRRGRGRDAAEAGETTTGWRSRPKWSPRRWLLPAGWAWTPRRSWTRWAAARSCPPGRRPSCNVSPTAGEVDAEVRRVVGLALRQP
jgi:hypothetical protein